MEEGAHQAASVADLQRWRHRVVTRKSGVAAWPVDSTGKRRRRDLAARSGDQPMIGIAQSAITTEAYFERILKSLSLNFPALFRVVGTSAFRTLVIDFLQAYPWTFYNIEDVGCHLSWFLQDYFLASERPFLPDLAALEWTILQASYGDNWQLPAAAPPASFPRDEWANARMTLNPSVYFLYSDWPIDTIWQARYLPDNEFPASVEDQPRTLLIFRAADGIVVQELEDVQLMVLQAMTAGTDLKSICEGLTGQWEGNVGMPSLMNWVDQWIQGGIIRPVDSLCGPMRGNR